MSLGFRIRSHARTLIAILPVLLALAPAGDARCGSVRGQGSFEFFVDLASIPSGEGSALQLIQIAVPTKEIRYVEKSGSFTAEVRFSIKLMSGDDVVHEKLFQMRDTRGQMPQVKDLSSFLCHIDSCVVDPGSYRLTVKVEDLQRKKRTLLGILRRTYLSSEVKDAAFEVQRFPADGIALADPILVWESGGGRLIPNPMQIYGLRKDTLSVYVQAAVPEAAGADSLDVRILTSRDTGEQMEEARFRIPVRGTRSSFLRMTDLAAYPSGSYRLTVETSAPGGLFASSGKDFTVVWELVNWQKPLRDIVLEARLVLSGKQFDEFSRKDLGEQEIFMRDFWKKLDPTPQTALNETFEKFVARVRYADTQFGTYERGALTDRGYILIRFGLPDDIINQPLPQTRDDLYEGLDKILTEYKIVSDGIMTEKSVKDVRPIVISPEKQRATRGDVGSDTGSFEVWTYGFQGDPLLPDDTGMTVDQGLRFLFVDKDGYGSYRLVGSSEDMTGDSRD